MSRRDAPSAQDRRCVDRGRATASGRRGTGPGRVLAEVLRGDLVEELAELLHLVLVLVGHRDAAGLEHLVGADDPASRSAARARSRPRSGSRPSGRRRRRSSAWKTLSRIATIRTSSSRRPRASMMSRMRSCVSGRGGTTPCWANAMALASAAPTQIGRYRSPPRSRSRTMGWFEGISTRTPTTSSSAHRAPYPGCRPAATGGRQRCSDGRSRDGHSALPIGLPAGQRASDGRRRPSRGPRAAARRARRPPGRPPRRGPRTARARAACRSGATTCSTSPASRSAAVRNVRRWRGSMPNRGERGGRPHDRRGRRRRRAGRTARVTRPKDSSSSSRPSVVPAASTSSARVSRTSTRPSVELAVLGDETGHPRDPARQRRRLQRRGRRRRDGHG